MKSCFTYITTFSAFFFLTNQINVCLKFLIQNCVIYDENINSYVLNKSNKSHIEGKKKTPIVRVLIF